jgi:hypothetical protein
VENHPLMVLADRRGGLPIPVPSQDPASLATIAPSKSLDLSPPAAEPSLSSTISFGKASPGSDLPAASNPIADGTPSTTKPETTSETPSKPEADSNAPITVIKAPPGAALAVEALSNFLKAPNWRERLKWCQKPESIRSKVERYYTAHPDGPVEVSRITFINQYPSSNGHLAYSMYELIGAGASHPLLLFVDQLSKADARVDWDAFVEFKDDSLLKFLEQSESPTSRFRVILRRVHSYDKDVPGLATKEAYEVLQPGAPFSGTVFAEKGSDLSRQLAGKLVWNMDIPVIAELAWHHKSQFKWVEITSPVTYGWRS